ncbi:metal-dependent hydrolase [Halomicrococcus sp. SG-WS-1]|uniref:metal-dependent hydrolase n=1 Tax=Halomicrococcus sp. SG-WS-1 TaxID=3439057 RepID=UPI003F7AE63E
MNKLGHWGIVLFIFSFVVYGLVVREQTRAAKIITVSGLGMGISPDIDLYTAWFAHRGVTHTIPAALFAGGVLATLAWFITPFALTSRSEEAVYGFLTGGIGVGCHILGDIITPMGIKILYPLAPQAYTFDIISAHNLAANLLLLLFGVITFQLTVRHAQSRESGLPYAPKYRVPFRGESDTETGQYRT